MKQNLVGKILGKIKIFVQDFVTIKAGVRGEKMSNRLGGIKSCKYKTSSWHLNGFPDGNKIGSTV